MQTIQVSKNDLREALITNRTKHVEEYEKALDGYFKAAEKEALKILEQIRSRTSKSYLGVNLERPSSYEEDYDTALEMLDWHQGEFVDLNQTEFKQYIQDEWGWKQRFVGTNSTYAD